MAREQPSELEFRRFWQRLQALGLNAYEARSYLVLVGHPRFKALELAARAHVPRQKIYEVLDSLVEKGFARVMQDRTKLFSAVPPDQALPAYLARRTHALEAELAEQSKAASGLLNDLMSAYAEGQGGGGTLDFLRLVNDPGQTAVQFRSMLAEARSEYLEFSRPPYAVDPLYARQDAEQVLQACARGVRCRTDRGARNAGRRAPAVPGGLRDRGRPDPADRQSPDENGRDGRPLRIAGAGGSGHDQARLDRRGVRARRHGRGDEEPVRGLLAARDIFRNAGAGKP